MSKSAMAEPEHHHDAQREPIDEIHRTMDESVPPGRAGRSPDEGSARNGGTAIAREEPAADEEVGGGD